MYSKHDGGKKKKRTKACGRFWWVAWEYVKVCMSISSVHGLNHVVTKKTIAEKLLWAILIIGAVIAYVYLAHQTWHRYQTNPTVMSFEVDFQNWNVVFTSATLCPIINDQQIMKVLRKMNLSEIKTNELRVFLKALYDQKSFRSFNTIPDTNLIAPKDYLDMLLNITAGFHVVTSATFSRTTKLQRVVTEMGICHTYNSYLSIYNSPEYWKENKWDLVDTFNQTVLVNCFMGTLSTTLSDFETEYYFYFHSYNDVIDVVTPKKYSKRMGIIQVQLNTMSVWTTEEVTKLSPAQRRCRLTTESNLAHSPVYSYTLCRKECRIQLCLEHCKCIPYFYRNLKNEKICDPKGMRCLANYSDTLETLYDKKNKKHLCECLPNCNEDRSFIEKSESGDWLFGNSLEWKISKFPVVRFKRDLIFGLTDVLIGVGGMAGLFLGCGVLSFVELFYFATLKLYWFARTRRHQAT